MTDSEAASALAQLATCNAARPQAQAHGIKRSHSELSFRPGPKLLAKFPHLAKDAASTTTPSSSSSSSSPHPHPHANASQPVRLQDAAAANAGSLDVNTGNVLDVRFGDNSSVFTGELDTDVNLAADAPTSPVADVAGSRVHANFGGSQHIISLRI